MPKAQTLPLLKPISRKGLEKAWSTPSISKPYSYKSSGVVHFTMENIMAKSRESIAGGDADADCQEY